jgi:multidrug efflux pump subunit AcrA (membrane-fusion protein)
MEYAMNSLDIDLLDGEVIHRKDLDAEPTAPGCRQLEPTQPSDSATVALEMVSEAAEAIRCLEEQSAEAVRRARELASSIIKQLESTEARAEHAEVAQQQSEVEVRELSAALARTQADLDIARRGRRTRSLDRSGSNRSSTTGDGSECRNRKNRGGDPIATSQPRRFVRKSLKLSGVETTLASPMASGN